jgi:hypothetical protein
MNIRPSTKLRVVSVSKLKTLTCLRKYFWKYILNLETKRINIPFWYGGILGAGFESLLLGKSDKQVLASMKKEDKRRVTGYTVDGDTADELRLQRRLIEMIVLSSRKQADVKRMKLQKSQIMFQLPLKCGLLFCGTEDGEGTYRNKPHLYEIKTTSRVSTSYLDSLTFGKQVNGYAYAQRKLNKNVIGDCCCCIFRKPQKRIKRNQTIDDFVEEIKFDIRDRPDMYYVWHKFKLGRTTVSQTGADIERQASILKLLYRDCGSKLLDPSMWPKQENKCFDYRGCEYLQLCKNPVKWELE